MMNLLRAAITLFLLLTLITGVVYPAVVTGVAKMAFRSQAEGSLRVQHGKQIGSDLIAQPFTDAKYFWPRPSAANYDATASAGSNLAASNPALTDAVKSRIDALRVADPTNTLPIPIDLVTASASGLDPHISVAAATYQAARVARTRGISVNEVQRLIDDVSSQFAFDLLGGSTVNVFQLNVMLDRIGEDKAP